MKKFLAYIFLFIFSFQVLPVKELGKLLFKGTMTEEVHESGNSDDGSFSKLKKEDPKILFHTTLLARQQYLAGKVHTAIHEADRLPVNFIPDILTPPPNQA